jgi:dienelactone hydrolase
MPRSLRTGQRLLTAIASVLLLLALDRTGCASEIVRFASASVPPSPLIQRQARLRGEVAAPLPGPELEAELFRPEGSGPFPALVGLHGCTGRNGQADREAGERYAAWGYVFLAVDSFKTRGLAEDCSPARGSHVDRLLDALGALDYLARQSFVAADRIGVVGHSQGGGVALAAVRLGEEASGLSERRFAAAVAFYPPCGASDGAVAAPTLILIGELDEWTPADYCTAAMEHRTGEGAQLRLVVYNGAYHGFDEAQLKGKPATPFGHYLEYNASAARRAIEETRKFLREHLGR